MRKNKTFMYLILMLFVSVFVLYGCDKEKVDPQINPPANVTITDGVVTWNSVNDVTGYRVIVGTNNYEVTTTSFDLKTLNLGVGTYQVTVISVKGNTLSVPSASVTYVVEPNQPIPLAVPTNVQLNDGVLTWDAVTDATSYVVLVNQNEYPVSVRSFNLYDLMLPEGTYQVKVKAANATMTSDPSNALSYTVILPGDVEAIYAAVLLLINPDYLPNMVEDDFTDADDYEDYLLFSRLAQSYSEGAVRAWMIDTDAINFFEHLTGIPTRMENVNSATEMKAELDSYGDFGLNPKKVAFILNAVGLIAMEINIGVYEDDISSYEEELTQLLQEKSIMLLEQGFLDAWNEFTKYASPEELALLDNFLDYNDEHYFYNTMNVYHYILSDMLYNFENHYPWYLEDDNPYTPILYSMLMKAKLANDEQYLQNLYNNRYNLLSPLYDVADKNSEIDNVNYYIQKNTNILESLEALLQLMTDEKEMYISSLENLTDYLVSIYGAIPLVVITKIDEMIANGVLTFEEYFILKDEIVDVLQSTLPSSDKFTNMYTLLMHIGSVFGDYDVNDYLSEAQTFGQINHISIDLMLTLLKNIDQTTVEEVMGIVDGMYTPGEYIYDEDSQKSYYNDPVYDYEKIIELTLYVGHYFEDFIEANQAKFAMLEGLATDDLIRSYLEIYFSIMLKQIEIEMDQRNYEFVSMIIEEMLADLPNILAAKDVINQIGLNIIGEFLDSEAQFFKDLISFIELTTEPANPLDLIDELEGLFGGFVHYNSAIMDELDKAAFVKLLRAVRVPLMVRFVDEEIIEKDDFNLLFNELLDPIATVLYNTVTIQKQFIETINTLNIADLISNWPLETHEVFMAVNVIVFDEVLTQTNEDLIFASINIIFDDILKNSSLLALTELSISDVDSMKTIIVDEITSIIAEIHTIASFDFNDLQEGELDSLYDLYEFLFNDDENNEEIYE